MQPERDRGPGVVARASADQQLASTPNTSDRSPAPARLTWNDRPGLLPIYARRRGWFDPELERLLRDHEAAALAIFDAIGCQRSRDVARRLLELCEEVA